VKEGLRLLGRVVLEKHGSFERVVDYYEGWHPEIQGAILMTGLTGKETKVEKEVIKPIRTFYVKGERLPDKKDTA